MFFIIMNKDKSEYRANNNEHILISCIADDLDAQPFMYLEGQERP